MGPGPSLPAAVARDQDRPPKPKRPSVGDSLQTRSTVSLVMAAARHGAAGKSRRRTKGGWLLAIPAFATAALALGVSAVSVPEAPARVDLDVMSGDEVAVTFSAPLSDGGSAVQSYEVGVLLLDVEGWHCIVLGGKMACAMTTTSHVCSI